MITKNHLDLFQCDDCGTTDYMPGIDWARSKGWAVARDRVHCYCPNCAPARRNVGCQSTYRYWKKRTSTISG